MNRGLIHLYTGEGKGKTTAALGLALRACGAGKKIVVLQFMKGRDTSEVTSLARLPYVILLRNKTDMGFWLHMTADERALRRSEHNNNLQSAINIIKSGNCDLLILDEAMSAYNHDAVDKGILEKLINEKPYELELVLTGRDPAPIFIEKADYITEMKKIKHPIDKGITARVGIEL